MFDISTIVKIFAIFSISMFILYLLYNRENFSITIGPVQTQSIIATNQIIAQNNAAASLLSSVDPSVKSAYATAYNAYVSAIGSLPTYSQLSDAATYDATTNSYICPASSPVPSFVNGKIICSANDSVSVFNCVPGTTFSYGPCINGTSVATRLGDIQPLNGGTQCPQVTSNVSCVNCSGSWSAWGACSASCGGGNQTQTYTITSTSSNGGSACSNNTGDVNTQSCNTQACLSPTMITYTASGTITIPAGYSYMDVTAIGGGGGGSSGANAHMEYDASTRLFYRDTSEKMGGGIGGAAGKIVNQLNIPITGNSFTYSVGQSGSGGGAVGSSSTLDETGTIYIVSSPNVSGSSGGNTTFKYGNLTLQAVGGSGGSGGLGLGWSTAGTSGGANSPSYGNGGAGGNGCNMSVNGVPVYPNPGNEQSTSGKNGANGILQITFHN